MAIFTYGEGYHNYHHEFQHDYRNGVKPWQYDPTKWIIWSLSKIGLTWNLRTVPNEKIMLAEMAEKERAFQERVAKHSETLTEATLARLAAAREQVKIKAEEWEKTRKEFLSVAESKLEEQREHIRQLQKDWHDAAEELRASIQAWREAHQLACLELGFA
jgi:stearoyl-CoA desaturase (delta-9 desaturase)